MSLVDQAADEFGTHVRHGGWRLGFLVACCVEPGEGQGERTDLRPPGNYPEVKVSASEFARRARLSDHKIVLRYRAAWEKAAADDGLVPHADELTPEDIADPKRVPEAEEFDWDAYYSSNGAPAHVGQASGENEWYTPPEYIEAGRAVLGDIDLDPASTAQANVVVGAAMFYDAERDGLAQPWHGRVWLNPPYADPLVGHFTARLGDEYDAGTVEAAIALVNNATETRWFHNLARHSAALCFPASRVKFWHPERESAPLQGQALLYLGPAVDRFGEAFASFGHVWRRL